MISVWWSHTIYRNLNSCTNTESREEKKRPTEKKEGRFPLKWSPKEETKRFQILWEIPVLLGKSHGNWHLSELEKPSLQGCDREVLYGKSPGLVVHHHLCTSDHIIKRNIMIKKEHIPSWIPALSQGIFSQPQAQVLQNQIKLSLNRLCRLSASFFPPVQFLSKKAPTRLPTIAYTARLQHAPWVLVISFRLVRVPWPVLVWQGEQTASSHTRFSTKMSWW